MAPRKQNKDTKGRGGEKRAEGRGKMAKTKGKQTKAQKASKGSKSGGRSKGTSGAGRVVKKGTGKASGERKTGQNAKASTSRGRGAVQGKAAAAKGKSNSDSKTLKLKAKQAERKKDAKNTSQKSVKTTKGGAKRKRAAEDDGRPRKKVRESHEEPSAPNPQPEERRVLSPMERLSLEVLCKIIQFLPLRDALKLQCLSRTLREAVRLHLRICKSINFTEGEVCGIMSCKMSDRIFGNLVTRCPDLTNIYGLHPSRLCKPHCKEHAKLNDCFTIKGMIVVLKNCQKLKGIETSDIHLLEALLLKLPSIKILGLFKNRGGTFPPPPQQSFCLRQNPPITKLHLTGVILPELPRMDYVIYLALKWVKFTNLNPFREFMAPRLHTFVMNNCSGPTNALKYVPLVTRLAAASNLTRLELVRVPFLGAFFQHVVEDTWRLGGFRQLKKILISACKHATEIDMGHLLLTAAESISEVYIQPSLTKDSLFLALSMAEPDFPKIDTISLGYVDPFPVEKGKWEPLQLALAGLADAGASEHAALITDVGVQHVGKDFSFVKNLNAYNCPHLINPSDWLTADGMCFAQLRSLHLNRCHAIKLHSFCEMLAELPAIETVYLERMFREPPKGCSRVGLSAGTGLGVSSAFVANQEPAPAAAAAAAPAAAVPPLIPQMNVPPAQPAEANPDVLNNIEDDLPEPKGPDGAGKCETCPECSRSIPKKSELSGGKADASVGHPGNVTDKSCSNPGTKSDSVKPDSQNDTSGETDGNISASSEGLDVGLDGDRRTENSDMKTGDASESGKDPARTGEEKRDAEIGQDSVKHAETAPTPKESFNGFQMAGVDMDCPSEVRGPNSICGVVPVSAGYPEAARSEPQPGNEATPFTGDETKSSGKGKRPMGGKAFFKKRAKTSVVPSTSASSAETGVAPNVSGDTDEIDGGASLGKDVSAGKDNEVRDVKTQESELITKGYNGGTAAGSESCVNEGSQVLQTGEGRCDISDSSAAVCMESESGKDSGTRPAPGTVQTKVPGYCGGDSEPNLCGGGSGAFMPDDSNGIDKAVRNQPKNPKDSCGLCGKGLVGPDPMLKSAGGRTTPSNDLSSDKQIENVFVNKGMPAGCDDGSRNTDSSQNDVANSELRKSGSDDAERSDSDVTMTSSDSGASALGAASGSVTTLGPDVPHTCTHSSETQGSESSANAPTAAGSRDKMGGESAEKCQDVKAADKVTSSAQSGKKTDGAELKKTASCCHDSSSDEPESPEPIEARKTVGTQTMYNEAGDLYPGPGPSADYGAAPVDPPPANPPAAEPTSSLRRDIPVFRCLSDVDDEELEEDTRQILTIKSRTLVSLTIHMVGVTDLEIIDSPQIKVVHGTACRVLKNVRLREAPKLNRVTFAQCNKLDHMTVIRDVTRLTPTSDRFIFLRPMAKFDARCIGEELFRIGNGYHGCLIQDHSLDPGTTQIQKARFIEKIKLVSSISFHILRLDKYPIFPKTFSSEPPWGRNLHDLTGTSPDSSPWEAMTDIPWLPHLENLSTQEEDKDAVDIIEEKLGLHKLYSMEHIWPFGCFEGLAEAIGHAEAAESALFPRTIGVYINTCDVSGIPTPDDYV